MILLIDNNDSFTYNVVELLKKVTPTPIHVKKGTELRCREAAQYDHILFSPGPGLPDDFPIMREILEQYDATKPILGICLGHQAICQYYGGTLINLPEVAHGVESEIRCNPESLLFRNIHTLRVGRYHSWAAASLPDTLRITATDSSGLIMGMEHVSKRIYGIQFHPESYITQNGEQILRNFIYGIS